MDQDTILGAMRAILEAPGYPLLKGYKDDFYVHDTRQIRDSWTDAVQLLWIVREYGTHLAHIGVHSKLNEYASAALSTAVSSGSPYEIYHLSTKGVRNLTLEEARVRLLVLNFVTDGRRVTDAAGQVVATFNIERIQTLNGQTGKVRFTTAGDCLLTPELVAALNQIAMAEMVKAWGSWFCTVQDVQIDGHSAADLIAGKSGLELSCA